jgi:hypothetical protein
VAQNSTSTKQKTQYSSDRFAVIKQTSTDGGATWSNSDKFLVETNGFFRGFDPNVKSMKLPWGRITAGGTDFVALDSQITSLNTQLTTKIANEVQTLTDMISDIQVSGSGREITGIW